MKRRAALATGLALCVLGSSLAAPPPAHASWTSTGAGAAAERATTMPTGTVPTVTAAGVLPALRTYTLTWPTPMLSAGRPVTGYVVTRSATLGGSLITAGTCTGVTVTEGLLGVYVPLSPGAAHQSCTDVSAVSLGTVRYRVTPVYGLWTGPASEWSLPTA